MSDKDGGQAFPVSLFPGPMGDLHAGEPGMSLRDYFAAKALAGPARTTMPEYELVALFGKNRTGITRDEILAKDAYAIADAMLKECSK